MINIGNIMLNIRYTVHSILIENHCILNVTQTLLQISVGIPKFHDEFVEEIVN